MNGNNLQNYSSDDNFLINIEKHHLADMLVNFLGKKEKLSYEVKKSFALRLNDIEQFYYLLNTKVSKEQYVNVEIFTVTFLFNDQTKRTINTIGTLNSYLETRDVEPISVTLEWHIVIKFPDSETIETQKVEVSFDVAKQSNIGNILINIEHTNQVWGVEVLNLLKNHILSLSRDISKKAVLASKLKELIDLKNFVSFFMLMILIFIMVNIISEPSIPKQTSYAVFDYYAKGNISKETLDEYDFISSNIDQDDQASAYNLSIKDENLKRFLLDSIAKDNEVKSSIIHSINRFVFSGLIFWLVLYYYLSRYIRYNTERSFILTTNRSVSSYDEYRDVKNKIEFYSISLIFFTIISGLVVNYIYSFL